MIHFNTLLKIIFTLCIFTYQAYANESKPLRKLATASAEQEIEGITPTNQIHDNLSSTSTLTFASTVKSSKSSPLKFNELFNCTAEQELAFQHFSQSLKTIVQKQEFEKLITIINPDASQPISISMIWFSGYYKKLDKPIIIGESKIGLAFYYNLLTALEGMKHLVQNGYIQFYTDNETYFSNKNQLDWIVNNYSNFRLYFIEDQLNILDYALNKTPLEYIPNKHNLSLFNYINYLATNKQYENIKTIKNLLEHAKGGNPAIASDTLRMIQLDPEKLALYIDVDEFCLWNEKENNKLWTSVNFIAYQTLNPNILYQHLQHLSHLFSYLEISHSYSKSTFAFPLHKINSETTNSKIISYFLTENQSLEIKNTFINHARKYLTNLNIYKTFTQQYDKALYSTQEIYFTPMFSIMNSTGPGFFCTPFSWCHVLTKEKFPYVKADERLEINTDISGTLSWGSLPVYLFSKHVENFNHRHIFQPYIQLSYLLTIYDFQRHNKNRFGTSLKLIQQEIYDWFKTYSILNPPEAKSAFEWLQACYQTTYYEEFKYIEKIFEPIETSYSN